MKRSFLTVALLMVILLSSCGQSAPGIQVGQTATSTGYKAVYLTKGPGELAAEDLKAHPEVIYTQTFEDFKAYTGSKIALWVDKNAIDLIEYSWINSPPQKYYPLDFRFPQDDFALRHLSLI